MKKILLFAAILLSSLSANGQFEQGTKYIGGNVTGLGLSYSKATDFQFGLGAEAGYFIGDGWMLKGNFSYEHQKGINNLNIGAGARYYFLQNGIFLGAGLEYDHYIKSDNSFGMPIEIGYCFYLNHHVALEPSVFYKMSFNDFADRSKVGLRLGIGYFF